MKTGDFAGSHTARSLSLRKERTQYTVGSKLMDEMKEKPFFLHLKDNFYRKKINLWAILLCFSMYRHISEVSLNS